MIKFFLFAIIILGFSCKGNDSEMLSSQEDMLLAEVKDKSLYLSEISKFNFSNLEAEDSVLFLKKYTKNWIKDQLLVLNASDKLTNIKEIESETEKFKTDLIKAAYQKKALESIEIEITEDDLGSYYEKHKEYFLFEENHYEIKFILLPRNTANLQQIRKNIENNSPSNFLETYCALNTDNCHLKFSLYKNRSYLTDVLNMPNSLLWKNNRYKYHYIDAENVLIYKILSIKKKGDTAPLDIVRNEVSKLCLHNKKQEYLLEIKEKSYKKAKNDKVFENYIN